MILHTLKKYRFFLILVFTFILLRLPSLYEPYWYGDEGIYLVLGQAIRKGLVLYSQIHDNKPPTLYYLAAISQTVFGFRLLLALWMIPTIYTFYLLSKKFLSTRLSLVSCFLFLVFTSIPLFEGNIANAEIFMLLPTILAVYIFQSKPGLPAKALAAAGLLLGFAFTIKIPVFIEFAFLVLWILLISCKFNLKTINIPKSLVKIFIFSFSFVVPILLYLIYFAYKGVLNDFLFAALLQNFGYLSSWSTGTHSGSAASGGLFFRGLSLFAFWILIIFLSVKKYLPHNFVFLSLWFSATIFGALMSSRPYPHYLIQVLPPLILIILFVFQKNISTIIKSFVAILFLIGLSLFINYKFYVYPVFSYYANFYTHLTNLSSPNYRNFFGPDVETIYEISAYLQQNTNHAERIFIWGDNPSIFALSDRLPVSKYTVAYHIVDFNQYQSVYNQLKINYPSIIVYYPQSDRPYPELDLFIGRYYRPVKTIGPAIIYQRLK